MAKVTWTDEQQKVINSRGGNLLVAAAAGSGKTAVLVERIIEMITDPHDPISIDQLLIVTFTNAAAAEMKERITEAISKKMEVEPNNKYLYKQLNLMNHASITTIHSFCLDVIRSHFHLLDIDPNFRIADGTETLLLKNDVLTDLIEDCYTEGTEAFFDLVESYGGVKYDRPLENLILDLYHFTRSYPWPERWLDRQTSLLDIQSKDDLIKSTWMDELLDYARLILIGIRDSIVKAIELCHKPSGPFKLEDKFIQDLAKIDDLIAASNISYTYLGQTIKNISLENIRIPSKDVDPTIKENLSYLRKEKIKKPFDKLNQELFFKDVDRLMEDIQGTYPILRTLCHVVKVFGERYLDAKKEKGLLDFSDLEHMALNLLIEKESTEDELIPTQVAMEIKEKYKEILIDEYQDSNSIQELVLTSISRKQDGQPNIFMVGDVKQSIYRFRMAKPELFAHKYATYSLEEGSLYRRIDLTKNFRSRENVLEGVNYIFKSVMNQQVGEITYDDLAALHVGAPYKEIESGQCGGETEVHLLDLSTEDEELVDIPEYEELKKLSNIEIEAKLICTRIMELFDPSKPYFVYDKSLDTYRKIDYKDIVILLRATSNWSDVILDELTHWGLPAYAESNSGYFDAIEVKTIISLLKIIDNPRQDIPLITVLRSPIVGLTADQLVEIRANLKEGNFYDAMTCLVDGELEQSELGFNVSNFIDQLNQWRKEAIHLELHKFLWKIYLDTHYYYYVAAMPGGSGRRANLDALIDKAIKFQKSSYRGLFNFIRFIEKIKENNGDFGAAKTLGPNENIIRVMSIHKSKGLEFPVVIVAGMGKGFNTLDQKQPILFHQDLGFGPQYVDHVKRLSSKTLPKVALRQKIKLENLSEEMRILYVALTRAREKLILTGTVKSLDKKLTSWALDTVESGMLPSFRSIEAKNYLDWIMPAVMRHKDAYRLREKAGIEPPIVEDGSSWQFQLWAIRDLIKQREESNKEEETKNSDIDTQLTVQDKLSWEYPKAYLNDIPIKITVSEIKKQYMDQDSLSHAIYALPEKNHYQPKFLEQYGKFTSVEKGTIFHQVMMHVNLKNIDSYDGIKDEIMRLIQENKITEEEAKTIYIKGILDFSKTDVYRRLMQATKVEKETPFVIGLPIHSIYSDIKSEEVVMLQGVIDCYFEENEELVLLDYKTDYVTEDGVDRIKKRYEKQLEYYEKALEQVTGKKVKQKYLYLASIGHMVSL